MPQCPSCGANQNEDYGMVTCPGCEAILFIDMEGVAHMGQPDPQPDPGTPHVEAAVEPHEELPMEALAEAQPESQPEPNFQSDFSPPDFADLDPVTPQDSLAFESSPAPELPPDLAPEPEIAAPQPDSPPEGASPEFSMDGVLGYSESEPENAPIPDLGPADDPLGINAYANSEFSQGKDGLLRFRVLISGIDSKEIRESIREAIEDSRFAWDPAKVMASISKGTLVIESLSPVKAAILINRIKRSPIVIRWEQYAITQMDDFQDS
jgi:hypothetical protein